MRLGACWLLWLLYANGLRGWCIPLAIVYLRPWALFICDSPLCCHHLPATQVLDGRLLMLFPSLGLVEQREFARSIGTSPEQIIDDLLAAQHHTQHF